MLHIYLIALGISAFITFVYTLEIKVYIKKHFKRSKKKVFFIERLLASIKVIFYIALIFPSILLLIQMLFLRNYMLELFEKEFDNDECFERI